ncbi:hypothetical protein LUZ61_009148 [Rhynchospora tenuis]|uniref:F-box domain-containing protein n=1 Tax=Rhynchospora tenuis TaxID=198213 RepID=A0AAD5ZWW1_9POAL|nr:hypothetical protein LUZ61_009148 [Rhynchospora tenuis]
MNYERRNMPGVDRISDLPRELKENILVRMPVKEAVRTCCLSKNWRVVWSSIPELVYDEHSISIPEIWQFEDTRKMVKFVDKFLLLHDGLIRKFVIADVKLCSRAVKRWTRVLLRKEIEEIQITSDICYNKRMWKVPPIFWNLQCLKEVVLSDCIIKLPCAFKGFKLLKSLSLERPDISECDLTKLIASCPLLENLNLCIDNIFSILIDALKLKQLRLNCIAVKNVCLRAPSIVRADLCFLNEELNPFESNLIDLLNCLPKLEMLELRGRLIRYLTYGRGLELSIKFYYLKSLHIRTNFGCQKEAAVVHQLFHHTPNLQELIISVSPDTYACAYKPEWDQSTVFERLKFVKIRECHKSAESVLSFLAFLLACTPVLLELSFEHKVGDHGVLRELVQLKRASKEAKFYDFKIIL